MNYSRYKFKDCVRIPFANLSGYNSFVDNTWTVYNGVRIVGNKLVPFVAYDN